MNCCRWLFYFPLLISLGACAGAGEDGNANAGPGRPNFLFILTDDQGIGDLSLHGNDSIRTPNMDALLSSGAKFNRFYVSPVCAPTRASFLSGMYHPRTGAVFVTRRRETMDDAVKTIPEYLLEAGYRTGLFGKWHNGATKPYDPAGQGFDEFLGFSLGHFNDYFLGELENEHNEMVPFSGDLTQILTDTAAAFMLADSDRPFFAMLTYQAPHTPVQVADKYWDEVEKRGLTDYNTGIYAMVESIDERLGVLLDRLNRAGKLANTIIVFSTDNGPNGDRYRMGLKGTKGHVDEGGVRVPFAIKFPGDHPANGRIFDTPAAHIDLLPTVLDMLDLPRPDSIDGLSLLPLLSDATASKFPKDRPIYTFRQGYDYTGYPGSVRDRDLLLVMQSPESFAAYAIHKDEGQRTDLMKEYTSLPFGVQRKISEMAEAYNEFAPSIARPELVAPPIDLDAANGLVRLLAHEGEPLGNTHFNDEYGWANDWFVDVDWEGARWPIQTSSDNTFNVIVKYHAENPIRLGLQVDSFTQHTAFYNLGPFKSKAIEVADRIRRKEVYPRSWRTITIEDFRIPGNAAYLHIFGGDSTDTASNLWIKEVQLIKQ